MCYHNPYPDHWTFWLIEKVFVASRMFHKAKLLLHTKALFNRSNYRQRRSHSANFLADFKWNNDKRFWVWRQRIFSATDSGCLLWRGYWTAERCSGIGTDNSRMVRGLSYMLWWAVWAVCWIDENISAQLNQFLEGGDCNMGSCIVVKDADEAVAQALV